MSLVVEVEMEDRLYRGHFDGPTAVVIAEDGPSRYELAGYFSWGYGGGGPLRLAEALVEDALGRRDARAVLTVKDHIVARFPRDAPWTLFRRHLLADVEAFGGEFPDELVMSVERSYQMEEVDEDEVDEDE